MSRVREELPRDGEDDELVFLAPGKAGKRLMLFAGPCVAPWSCPNTRSEQGLGGCGSPRFEIGLLFRRLVFIIPQQLAPLLV